MTKEVKPGKVVKPEKTEKKDSRESLRKEAQEETARVKKERGDVTRPGVPRINGAKVKDDKSSTFD